MNQAMESSSSHYWV